MAKPWDIQKIGRALRNEDSNSLPVAKSLETSTAVFPSYIAQHRHARDLMLRYRAYAIEIGVKVFDDEMQATREQAKLLKIWWRQNT